MKMIVVYNEFYSKSREYDNDVIKSKPGLFPLC